MCPLYEDCPQSIYLSTLTAHCPVPWSSFTIFYHDLRYIMIIHDRWSQISPNVCSIFANHCCTCTCSVAPLRSQQILRGLVFQNVWDFVQSVTYSSLFGIELTRNVQRRLFLKVPFDSVSFISFMLVAKDPGLKDLTRRELATRDGRKVIIKLVDISLPIHHDVDTMLSKTSTQPPWNYQSQLNQLCTVCIETNIMFFSSWVSAFQSLWGLCADRAQARKPFCPPHLHPCWNSWEVWSLGIKV